MGWITSPTSFRLANPQAEGTLITASRSVFGVIRRRAEDGGAGKPSFGHLVMLVFEAVLEVVCVSLPGYIVARQGMFNAEHQKFVANLNVALFTPCLIWTKLASQLNADKLADLAVIPVIFVMQTAVSYLVSITVSKAFGFGKRPANFVTAMGVFGNSNSLPISLVISLANTLNGLHWDRIPGDNDDEVAARGILYLLIFQQLGQLVRWSWGYHVLLAPPHAYENGDEALEEGRYRDDPDMEEELIPGLDGNAQNTLERVHSRGLRERTHSTGDSSPSFDTGGSTPVMAAQYAESMASDDRSVKGSSVKTPFPNTPGKVPEGPANGNGQIISFPFPRVNTSSVREHEDASIPSGVRGWIPMVQLKAKRSVSAMSRHFNKTSRATFEALPSPMQRVVSKVQTGIARFSSGLWEFMNPPLWAMLIAIIVASIPPLQRAFFEEGTFLRNSVTRAIGQSGGVAVPLILVVLGANLARNTLPAESLDENSEENKIGTKLMIASLISRMLLPTVIMAPILALMAKYVPVSILDDPIFVIVCFLLTGAPSALQLAQICQINGVYESVMAKLLFQSYVVWILPSTLILVMCALEVVAWANQ